MQILKNIFSDIFKKPSLYLFVVIIIFSVDRCQRWVNFEKDNFPFVYDVDQYYSYLPAAFIYHDLSFSYPHAYWTTKLENGNSIPKVTIGMAIMYSPFFFIGDLIAKNSSYKADGYSLPYKWSIHFGSILFSLFGLWFCRKNLLHFFCERVTLITLICIYFGTNLFYYTYGFGEMPHAYLFFIFSLFIYFVLKWHKNRDVKSFLIFTFLAGFSTLIRPTECMILLFPLLLGVKNSKDIKERIQIFLSYKFKLLFAFLLFIFPFFLQMLYWKVYAGQWLFFSYGKERFFFGDPQIINFLFSFRKGWLIYTPIMLFAVVGIILLRKKAADLFIFTILYFILNIYLLSCWWDWPFGGSFGCRPLIQHYAFFAFAFAAFLNWYFEIFKTKLILNVAMQFILFVIFYLMINLNFDQSWLYKYAIIPSDGLTKEAYFYILGKEKFTISDSAEFRKQKRVIVNREEMLNGKRD
ncbi:MAG: glycosyltransferase family 39 protein [Bacteroidetes bacterium]|nr:glycosyltransferase family 39 protein [Bacteroidota bacterium]